ncbi:LppP/LprE family lipoprotein [Nocardia albiluteola]|uniref:LppP/LprE family lipoprotein n=1 Tax=Nocardia albiluteola TaxID=2842303 RepID=UPI0027DF7564|nr:LppP/LprE family lipoprotein [Nocardia albiluteola]
MSRTTGGALAAAVTSAVIAAGLLTGCGSSGGSAAAPSTATPVSQAHSQATAAPIASGEPSPAACGVDLSSPAVAAAVRRQPTEPATHSAWDTDPKTFEGNFNPCATLSTAIITIQGATGSSPNQALMFHKGTYLGTATSRAYGFTSLDTATTTDDTVVLDYKTPGSCNACADGTVSHVQFHWDGTHVVMTGKLPSY